MKSTRSTPKKKILILYTGGTLGMISQSEGSPLQIPPLTRSELVQTLKTRVPELAEMAQIEVNVLMNRDSAHVGASEWIQMAKAIRNAEKRVDGVVVLHGTDTLAYSASALSFLLRPCRLPVILTGAQRPLAALRTDARRNLISAVQVACTGPRSLVNQVCVFFDDHLFQGNQVRKRSALDFDAFESPQAMPLALVGTEIEYLNASSDLKTPRKGGGVRTQQKGPGYKNFKMDSGFSKRVLMLHVTPHFCGPVLKKEVLKELDGLILVVFPSGTAPTADPEFVKLMDTAREIKIPVIVTTEGKTDLLATQSKRRMNPEAYAAGRELFRLGAIWARGLTPECAFVKAAWILAQKEGKKKFRQLWARSYAGEWG